MTYLLLTLNKYPAEPIYEIILKLHSNTIYIQHYLYEIHIHIQIHTVTTIKPNMRNQVKQVNPLHLQNKQISNTTFNTISDK